MNEDRRAFDALARPGDQRAREVDDQCVVVITATYTLTPEAAHRAAVYHAQIPDTKVMHDAAVHSINNALMDPDLYQVLVASIENAVTPAPVAEMLGLRLEALEIAEFGGDADDDSIYDAICESITSDQATAIREFHEEHKGNVDFKVGNDAADNPDVQQMVSAVAATVSADVDWDEISPEDIINPN